MTQEVDDIISSPIVKEAIINNSDLQDTPRPEEIPQQVLPKYEQLLGLSDKEKDQILSINQANRPGAPYREVWIGLGGTHSGRLRPPRLATKNTWSTRRRKRKRRSLCALPTNSAATSKQAVRRLAAQRRRG